MHYKFELVTPVFSSFHFLTSRKSKMVPTTHEEEDEQMRQSIQSSLREGDGGVHAEFSEHHLNQLNLLILESLECLLTITNDGCGMQACAILRAYRDRVNFRDWSGDRLIKEGD